jgi:glucosyl-3-phosphoglycerate synthase
VARPLIALLFPELAGLVQPLAGEWAVRRDAFARLSVPTGYAVELTALVDTLETRGIDAIAQVDLGRRAHRHQALRDLGGMATQILAAALDRAGHQPPGDATLLRQYHRVSGTIEPIDRLVPEVQRPPAAGFLP